MDSGLGEEVVVIKVPGLPGNRLVFASTGPVNRDYDDIRRFSDAAVNGIQRSVEGSWLFFFSFFDLNCWFTSMFLTSCGVCLPFQCLKSWHAAPPAGVPSTRRLQEQHLGGCARSPSCTLHGEKISWLMVYRLPVMTGLVYKCYHPCMEIERCVRWTQAAADTTHSHSRDAVRNHNDAVAKFRNCIRIVSLYGAMN